MLTQGTKGLITPLQNGFYTNGIESVWSFLRRSIIDAYHRVSSKHVDAYLDELEHRLIIEKTNTYFATR